MDTITPNTGTQTYATQREIDYQVKHREGSCEVDDHVALAIAAQWQSPGTVGAVLASLASGHTVGVTELLDDIYHTRREAENARTLSTFDDLCLGMLATWALNHPSRTGK